MAVAAPGQPPGTDPPRPVGESDDPELPKGLRAEGFYFLDQTGTPVLVPGMSWEELERLRDVRDGVDSRSQAYIFESLEITGSVSGVRAELDVSVGLTVEPTGDRRVAVPLRMSTFHLLQVREVTGVDAYWVTVAEDGSGYQLWVQTSERASVRVSLSMSARVERGPPGRIRLDLPEVPSVVRVKVDEPDWNGEVSGRGDEVVQAQPSGDDRTELMVESSGGSFDLRWSAADRGADDSPLLEVDSLVDVRWDGPQDQPIASVQMTIRNLRGALRPLSIRLPPRSILLEPPTVESGSTRLEVPSAVDDGNRPRLDIPIPEDARLQRVDLTMDLQLENTGASTESPLELTIPTVVDALRHEGELRIETGSDYRLRWESQPWVQSVISDASSATSSRPTSTFRFDRDAFRLPVWLSAQRRQLRLTGNMRLVLQESTAELTMEIRPSGQSADGRVTFDPSGWKLRAVNDLETGEPIDSFESGEFRELVLNTRGGEEPAPVRVIAETELDAGHETGETIRLRMPRIVEQGQSVLVQESLLNIRTGGRSVFVVDLAESSGLDRIPETGEGADGESGTSRYRLLPSESEVELVGALVEQPQRITLAGNATVELDGSEVLTTVDWTVTSQFDLEGRLMVQIDPGGVTSGGGASDESGGDGASGVDGDDDRDSRGGVGEGTGRGESSTGWTVSVDDVTALLRPVGSDRYELVSDRLRSGPVLVRWRLRRPLREVVEEDLRFQIPLPRPVLADTSIKGAFSVMLRGDDTRELVAEETPESNPIRLDALPRNPIRVRARGLSKATRDLMVRQAIVRTAIGDDVTHEQVLANVIGGERFEVALPLVADGVTVEARVDGEPVGVRRTGNRLVIDLPAGEETHAIDLRLWVSTEASASFAELGPVVELPRGVSRAYWQLTVPKDSHVIWASQSIGRAMQWRFDRWRLLRTPIETDETLGRWIGGGTFSSMPSGNRYLYVGSNVTGFRVAVATQGLIWVVVGSLVLFVSVVLTYLPSTRHPLFAVAAAVALAGVVAVSPDAAVLAGQLAGLALLLVVVMLGMRKLLSPRPADRALGPASQVIGGEGSTHPSARSAASSAPESPSRSQLRRPRLAETQSMASPAASGEVSR